MTQSTKRVNPMSQDRRQRDMFTFFVGIMVGILGNFLVSTTIEIAKATFEKGNISDILWYWALMFIISSVFTFQLTKWAVRRFGIAERELRAFDIATIILVLLGFFVIVWDKFLRA